LTTGATHNNEKHERKHSQNISNFHQPRILQSFLSNHATIQQDTHSSIIISSGIFPSVPRP
jgi:hypothetical protein